MSPLIKSVDRTARSKQAEDEEVIASEPLPTKSPESTSNTRAKKIRRSGGIQQLSEELLLEILCRVPPEELKVCKCVCKYWSRLLDHEIYNRSFLNSNLLHSTPSILFSNNESGAIPISGIPIAAVKRPRRLRFASSSTQFEFHQLDLNWLRERTLATKSFGNCFNGWISTTSSDGALLIISLNGDSCVVNPLTRQAVALPYFKHRSEKIPFLRYRAIAHIPDTRKFKVLTVGKDVNGSTFAWYVLTVGTNMCWEVLSNVPSECIPSVSRTPSETNSLSIGGNIYVPFLNDNFTFAAFDLFYETAHSVEIPSKIKAKQRKSLHCKKWWLLHMDKHLGCTTCDNIEVIEVWKLEDSRRSEWTLMLNVDVSSTLQLKRSSFMCPHILLQSGQVLLMHVRWLSRCRTRTKYLAYFVSTKTFQSLKGVTDRRLPLLHRYSLAPLF